MSQVDRETYQKRVEQVFAALDGPELYSMPSCPPGIFRADREPIIYQLAMLHSRREHFDLVACLADIVRHLATAKNSAIEIASNRPFRFRV